LLCGLKLVLVFVATFLFCPLSEPQLHVLINGRKIDSKMLAQEQL